MLLCKFCNKECKNDNSLRNHQRLCKLNPDMVVTYLSSLSPSERIELRKKRSNGNKGVNQYTKAKELGLDAPVISKESIAKGIETKRNNGTLTFSNERKERHSKAMKLAVENNPESYTSSNRGRTKQIEKYGLKFQGKWELTFYEYCLTSDIKILRTNEWFPYNWNGDRKYFPDFYLPDLDVYVEVKGYEVERDRAKWRDFPKTLVVIKKDQMKAIKENSFDLVTFIGSVI